MAEVSALFAVINNGVKLYKQEYDTEQQVVFPLVDVARQGNVQVKLQHSAL
jgi:hypothetical protein